MMEYRWTSVLVLIIISFSFTTLQGCQLPTDIQQSTWVTSGQYAVGNVKFGTTILQGFNINIQGENFNDYTCVNYIAANGIYVFRSDSEFYDPSANAYKRVYICLRLKKITNNLYSFYILGDPDKSGGIRYNAFTDDDAPPETCNRCTVSNPPTDTEYSLLKKDGTSDPVPNDYTFKYCPCETTTDVCYPAVPPKNCKTYAKNYAILLLQYLLRR